MATVLVLDDRGEIRTLLASVVEREGHQSAQAVDAVSARLAIDEGLRPSLVIADVGMPRESGLEFVQKLRARVQHAHVPVLFVTAHPELIDAASIPGTGAVEILCKPFRFEQIAALLHKLLPK